MKKIISLFIVCVCLSSFVMADDCSDALSEAKSLYNSGNYQKAKSLFEYVKSECGSSYGDASAWIRKCNDALTPNLTVSKSSLSFGSSGGSQSITVSSNRSWSLQGTSSSMFTVQRSGNTVTVQCNKNTTSSYRSDYFTIVTDGGDKTVKIVVNQEVPTVALSVSKTSISCTASGTTEYLTVTSSKSWEVQYASGTMYDVTRSGNTLTVKIKPNSGTESRSDYFNVRTTDGEKVVKITLSQEAAQELSVSQTSINCSASGTTEYLTVTSSKTWEVQYASGTMYDVTRNGNTLTVKIKPNSTKESRSDYFNVRTKDGSKVIKVQMTQGGTKDITLSKTSISCSYSGTTEYITVTSGKAWEVQYASGTMYDVTRSGNTLTVKIKPNPNTESRSDYFNVKTTDGSKVVKVQMTQTGRPNSGDAGISYTHSDGKTYKLIGTTRSYTDNADALKHLTTNITEWEECRTGAITSVGKGVAIYGSNGYAYTSIPTSMSEKIKYANDNSLKIHEVCMSSDANYWCVAYGDGGWQSWAPSAFNDKMRACIGDGEKVVSMAINNSGDWVIITDQHLYASNTTLSNKLSEVSDMFGYIYSVALTDKGYVICAKKGIYYHNIPTKVLEKIKEMAEDRVVKVVKFTDDGTSLVTDGDKLYKYYM